LNANTEAGPRVETSTAAPFSIDRRSPLACAIARILLAGAAGLCGQAQADEVPARAALEEIVVTAQRRSQSIQDVPYNITAVGEAALRDSGATSLNDLARLVPGLTAPDTGPAAPGRNNQLTLRGLQTQSPGGGAGGPAQPGLAVSSVATYFGETPVFFPVALEDIERVEILRGPQGTLYGSGSEAGTIRFIPKPPDFKAVSGDIDVSGGYTEHAANANGSAHGSLNVPLADNAAFRISAGETHLAGFIDAVDRFRLDAHGIPIPNSSSDPTSAPLIAAPQRGVNWSDQWYGRSAFRWEPSDAIAVEFDYLHQYSKLADAQAVTPNFSGGAVNLSGYNPAPGPANNPYWPNGSFNTRPSGQYSTGTFAAQPYDDKIDLGSIVVTADVGLATLTSASSYFSDRSFALEDDTGGYFNLGFNNFYPYNHYPRLLGLTAVPAEERSFVQEIRLVSKQAGPFDYVLGLYYQDEKDATAFTQFVPGVFDYLASPPAVTAFGVNTSTYGDIDWLYNRHTEFTDKAIFGELTYHVTNEWQVTGGLRFFHQSFTGNVISQLPLCGSLCSTDLTNPLGLFTAQAKQSVSKHIGKLSTSYSFSERTKVYATYSEGFRRGGANGLPENGPFASLPQYSTFAPDLAKNYEVGIKGEMGNGRIRYDVDIFYIDLDNFQFNTRTLGGVPVTLNGQKARSEGVETQLEAAVTDRFTALLGYTYTKAQVTRTFDILDYAPYALVPSFGGTGQTTSIFGGPITSGTKLPGVPQSTLAFGLDYKYNEPPIGGAGSSVTLHLDGSYRGSSQADINASSLYNWNIPSSFIANARMSLMTREKVRYDFFINNLTNKAAYSGGSGLQSTSVPLLAYAERIISRPRTFGIELNYKF